MFRQKLVLALGLAGALTTQTAFAATATGNLNVSGTVVNSCTTSGGTLAFGSGLDGISAVTGTGSISLTCTSGTSATISLDAGQGTGATVAARKMTGATNTSKTLTYTLYTDSGRTTLWGDGTTGTSSLDYTGIGSADTVTVYGALAGGQLATAQAYSDTVVVTVSY